MTKRKIQSFIGKTVLVGLSFFTKDEKLIEQTQYWGTIVNIDEEYISIRQENGEIRTLPPQPECLEPAEKGEYHLKSTGEVIVDPDYTTTWSIYKNADE